MDYWDSAPAGNRWPSSNGVDRLWILDVAGERVVLDIGIAPGVGRKEFQLLFDIVESARFVQQ